MKHLPDPLSYKDFRLYLKSRLKAEGLSYRAFVAKHPRAVGLPALGQLLSNPRYRMGNEAFYRLIRVLRLGSEAEAHLLFLKIEDDVRRDEEGAQDLRRVLRRLARAAVAAESGGAKRSLSADAQAVGEVFEILPGYLRVRVAEHFLTLLEIFTTRHPRGAALENARGKVDVIRQIAKSRS